MLTSCPSMLNLVKLEHFSNLFVSDSSYSEFQDLSFSARGLKGTPGPTFPAESVDGAMFKASIRIPHSIGV